MRNKYVYMLNNNKRNIKYYNISEDGSNIPNILEQFDYDISNFSLIQVNSDTGISYVLTPEFQII